MPSQIYLVLILLAIVKKCQSTSASVLLPVKIALSQINSTRFGTANGFFRMLLSSDAVKQFAATFVLPHVKPNNNEIAVAHEYTQRSTY